MPKTFELPPLPSHADQIPQGEQVIYDYGLETQINGHSELTNTESVVKEVSKPLKNRSLNREFLQRATAGTLLATSIMGTVLGGSEAAKGTERVTSGQAVAEVYSDQDYLRMASDIAYGFEKVLGGACEIVEAQDQHGLPQDARPELNGRTAVAVTLRMKYSPAAQAAREASAQHGMYEKHLDEAEPKLNAYATTQKTSNQIAIWLGQGQASSAAYSGVGLMTHAPATPTREKDGAATYFVSQTLYLPDATSPHTVPSINFQVITSVSLTTSTSGSEIARAITPCEGALEVRDGAWQLAK